MRRAEGESSFADVTWRRENGCELRCVRRRADREGLRRLAVCRYHVLTATARFAALLALGPRENPFCQELGGGGGWHRGEPPFWRQLSTIPRSQNSDFGADDQRRREGVEAWFLPGSFGEQTAEAQANCDTSIGLHSNSTQLHTGRDEFSRIRYSAPAVSNERCREVTAARKSP